MYVLSPEVNKYIKTSKTFGMDELIKRLLKLRKKSVFFLLKRMNGLILEIGITTLKRLKNNLLIVGYGSIGKKYSQSASQFFDKRQIHIFSKHLRKNNYEKLRSMKDLNYIILSNRAN